MQKNNLKYFEFLGIIGVIVSLLFVAYQVQQANRIARVTTEYEIRNNRSEWQSIFLENPEITEFMIRIIAQSNSIEDMPEIDRRRAYIFAMRGIETWAAAETAFANGMLSNETYDYISEDINNTIKYQPGMHFFLNSILSDYPSLAESDIGNKIANGLEEYRSNL